ncbi:MAG: hypothetical protein EAX90_01900 [Candidatus Heimdallarchaeota archaeon]|nr:hypothetical protein [Candidatus Heimdallarchaeota archaeon]
MVKKVKQGMSAKEIATLHYELLLEGNKEEWIKTIKKSLQSRIDDRGASPYYWWKTGRRYKEQYGYSYTYKLKDERQSSENHIKLFFHRLNKEGNQQGQVPIHLIKDEEEDGEWRVDVSSW